MNDDEMTWRSTKWKCSSFQCCIGEMKWTQPSMESIVEWNWNRIVSRRRKRRREWREKKLHCELCSMKWKRAGSCRRTLIFIYTFFFCSNCNEILHHLHSTSPLYFDRGVENYYCVQRSRESGIDRPLEEQSIKFYHTRSLSIPKSLVDSRLILSLLDCALIIIENPHISQASNSRVDSANTFSKHKKYKSSSYKKFLGLSS